MTNDRERLQAYRQEAAEMEMLYEKDTHEEAELEIVEFRMGGEWYAFESRHVREIYPLKEYCPLPCTPAFVLGLVNVRGQLVAVLDLAKLFGPTDQKLAGNEVDSRNQVLILRHATVGHDRVGLDAMEVGILVDKSLEIGHLPRHNLQPVAPEINGLRREFSLGMSAKNVLLLDAEKLLTSRHIVVNESVHEPILENAYETLVADI
jgi:purine-binding chemotaxis protein CheW